MFEKETILKILQNFKEGNQLVLEEKEDDGKAELAIVSNNYIFAISLSHQNKIKAFKHQKVADWIVLEFLNSKEVVLHLIELKRSIKTNSWQKIKEQFKGAYEHSALLKGLFDYEIKDVICYSAYVFDKLNLESTSNPILLKNSLGNDEYKSAIDWKKEKISMHNIDFLHVKIELNLENGIGKGCYQIKRIINNE